MSDVDKASLEDWKQRYSLIDDFDKHWELFEQALLDERVDENLRSHYQTNMESGLDDPLSDPYIRSEFEKLTNVRLDDYLTQDDLLASEQEQPLASDPVQQETEILEEYPEKETDPLLDSLASIEFTELPPEFKDTLQEEADHLPENDLDSRPESEMTANPQQVPSFFSVPTDEELELASDDAEHQQQSELTSSTENAETGRHQERRQPDSLEPGQDQLDPQQQPQPQHQAAHYEPRAGSRVGNMLARATELTTGAVGGAGAGLVAGALFGAEHAKAAWQSREQIRSHVKKYWDNRFGMTPEQDSETVAGMREGLLKSQIAVLSEATNSIGNFTRLLSEEGSTGYSIKQLTSMMTDDNAKLAKMAKRSLESQLAEVGYASFRTDLEETVEQVATLEVGLHQTHKLASKLGWTDADFSRRIGQEVETVLDAVKGDSKVIEAVADIVDSQGDMDAPTTAELAHQLQEVARNVVEIIRNLYESITQSSGPSPSP